MRHLKKGRRLGRNSSHRTSMFRNMAASLIEHERIVTTIQKAKELRPIIEKMITMAKKGTLHSRRVLMARMGTTAKIEFLDKEGKLLGNSPIRKLCDELAIRYKDRPGGYTRIMKLHPRRLGDAGETAIIELLKEGETKVSSAEKKPVIVAPAPVAPTTPLLPASMSQDPATDPNTFAPDNNAEKKAEETKPS